MQKTNTLAQYLYCLVDKPNNRFKLGTTSHQHYAPALVEAYDLTDSFQVGLEKKVAQIWYDGILEQQAASILTGPGNEQTESSVWLSMTAFDSVCRLLMVPVPIVAPAVLHLVQLDLQKAQLCVEIEKILGGPLGSTLPT